MKSLASLFLLFFLGKYACALELKFIPWDSKIAKQEFAIESGKKVTPIDYLHPSVRSVGYAVPGGGSTPLSLLSEGKKNADGTPVKVPIIIPEANKHPLVIFVPEKESPLGVRPLVLNDSTTAFKWGSYQMINTTGRNIVFACDKKLTKVPGKWTLVFASPGGDARNVSVALFLPEATDRPFYSSVWQHSDDLRQLVIIVASSDENDGPVSFKFVLEDKRLLNRE